MSDLSRNNRLMTLALFLWASGEGLFSYLQPIYIQQLGASPTQVGGVLSLAGLAMMLSYLPGGILADRIPRKTMIMSGWAVGIIAALMMAAARDWHEFVPGVMLYFFSAFCVPAINATIADSAGGAPLERVLTLVYASFWAGSIVSPWIGGWLADRVGMRHIYLIAAVCYSVSALVILMIKPPVAPARAGGPQRLCVVPNAAASLRLYLRGGMMGLIVFAIFLALYIGLPLAPNLLKNVAGWPVGRIGLLGSLNALGAALLSPALGRWSASASRRQRGLWAAQSLVWISLGLLLIGAWMAPAAVFAAYFLRGSFSACSNLTSAQIVGNVSPENRGVVFGLIGSAFASAQMVAPYLAGLLYNAHPGAPVWAGLLLIPLAMLLTPTLSLPSLALGRAAAQSKKVL